MNDEYTSPPAVLINIPSEFVVGVRQRFSITTYAGTSMGVMVKGKATMDTEDFQAYYLEVNGDNAGKYLPLEGDTFGPSSGFPMMDITAYMAVEFTEAGDFNLTVQIVKVEDESVVCEQSVKVKVLPSDETTNPWMLPDGGPAGLGMLGYSRLVMKKDTYAYKTGGISLPTSFEPDVVIANIEGGVDAYWDSAAKKIVLCRNGTELADSTVLNKVSILMFGM